MKPMVKAGFAVFWIEMPYQFHRRPHPTIPSGQVFLARTPKRLAGNIRQAVLDARRAASWLSRHSAIDPKRIGLFGISLGGMVGATMYSVDDIPSYAVFMLSGADFPSLVMESEMTAPFVRKSGLAIEPLRKAMSGLDPLDFREGNSEKKVLLINVKSDLIVPHANALKLKEAFPSARQVWLSLGHYTAMVHILWTPNFVAENFRKHL